MDRLRTFGIVAHIDAGKTTLTERILHDAGAQPVAGSVDEGTTTTDWLPQERARGISIVAATTRITWGEHTLQVVDTPGHVDFVAEVERCLHVLDGVVVVVDGVRGVESQTEAVWERADAHRLPRLVFVNKLDRVGADFAAVLAELRSTFDCRPAPWIVPLCGSDGALAGVGNAATGEVQWFGSPPDAGLVESIRKRMHAARDLLVEVVADVEPAVLAAVVEGRVVSPAMLQEALRRAVLSRQLVPVCAGAALWNRGVDWLLDAVVAFLPGAGEGDRSGRWSLDRVGDPEAPFCGLVFKVQHVGQVWNYVQVVRGRIRSGMTCGRSRAPAAPAPIGDLWVMQADRHRIVEEAGPGEIVVLPGELGFRTGETLFAAGFGEVLPTPKFPPPVLAATFEPERAEDGPLLLAALRELAVDDPTLRVDHANGQTVVRGMGELHLEIVADLLRERLPAPFRRSAPKVELRESVRAPFTASAEVRAVIAGVERAATCTVRVEPTEELENPTIVPGGGATGPAVTAALVEVGARSQLGLRLGPMVGLRIEVVAAGMLGGGDLVEGLVEQAAAKSLADAMDGAGLLMVEPEVAIEVWCPEDCSAAVLADLRARRAELGQVASGRLGARVRGRVALTATLGYVTKLRSMTRGRGHFVIRPAGLRRRPESEESAGRGGKTDRLA